MQLTINVSGADFTEDLRSVLSTLTSEEKKDLAKQVMLEWLKQPVEYERITREEYALQRVRDSRKDQNISPERAKEYYEYRDAFSGWKSTREIMVAEILTSAIKMYQDLAKELVQTDPKLIAVWEEVREVIRKNYPNYVHDASVHFLASKMDELSKGIQQAMFSNMSISNDLNQVKSRIGLPQ